MFEGTHLGASGLGRYWSSLPAELQRNLNYRYHRGGPLTARSDHIVYPEQAAEGGAGEWSGSVRDGPEAAGRSESWDWTEREMGGYEQGSEPRQGSGGGWGGGAARLDEGKAQGLRTGGVRPQNKKPKAAATGTRKAGALSSLDVWVEKERDQELTEVELAGGWRIEQQAEADREKAKQEEQLRRWKDVLSR